MLLDKLLGYSFSLLRRHLTESRRAIVASPLANVSRGGDRKADQEGNCSLNAGAS